MPTQPRERQLGLDLLRLVAVVMVLVSHLPMEPLPASWRESALRYFIYYGSLGVSLFFVLSGFLVAGLLFSEFRKRGEMSIRRFYIRRAWKIYPPFYLLTVFTYFFSLLVMNKKMNDSQVFAELFFYQSYRQGMWNHTWSLAVEEHFYIVLPLILYAMVRKRPMSVNPFQSIPRLAAITTVGILLVRIFNYWIRSSYKLRSYLFATHLRLDALFFGVLIAYLYHFHSDAFRRTFGRWRHVMIVAGAALGTLPQHLLPSLWTHWFYHTFGLTIEYLASAVVLIGVVLCKIPKNWVTRPLALLGSYSYSIYLWHMATIYWVTPQLRDSVPYGVLAAVFFLGAFVIGIATAVLWELPALKLRDRLYPSMLEPPKAEPTTASEPAPVRQAA